MSFYDFKMSKIGDAVGPLLADADIIAAMEEASHGGKPAVAALDGALPKDLALGNVERQYVGRWIRDVLAERGWRTGPQRRFAGGHVFTSGTVYTRAPGSRDRAGPAKVPDTLRSTADRVARARAMIAEFSRNDYGVETYLHDKRAEAARETGG